MMQRSIRSSSSPHGTQGVEPDKVPGKLFLGLLVLLVAALAGVGFAVRQLMWFSVSKVKHDVDLSLANPNLLELRASEEKALTSYDLVDEKLQIYRIPIDRAMDIYVNRRGTEGR